MKRWTEEEVRQLRRLAEARTTDTEISIRLGRSERAIRAKRERMQLHVTRTKKINAANARCPFFELYAGIRVRCRADEDTTLTIGFSNAQKFQDYARNNCQDEWRSCYIARAIAAHFDDYDKC